MRRTLAPWVGLALTLCLIAAAILVPWILGQSVHVMSFPPLHAEWMPRVGPGTVPAVVLGAAGIRFAIAASARAPWRFLLLGSALVALAWMISLATVDGLDGIGRILDTQYEYLRTARNVTDFAVTLQEYVSRIPLDAPQNWPVHIAGHPPGALLFFVVLVRLGLGSGLAAGFVVIVFAASIPVAVLLTVQRLGAEESARRAAPFLVFGPAAIWLAVSADAVFAAFAAWGLCLLAFGATAARRRAIAGYSVAAGLLLGYCVMLSYGLPLLAVLAVPILVLARNWRPLPWAVASAAAVVCAFAVTGFVWWQAYPVLVARYWDGIASRRQYTYWVWGNLAALALSAGPLLGSSLAVAVRKIRSAPKNPVVLLVLAAALAIVIADLSGMSRAEVERIWLPFVPWLLLGTAMLSQPWRRGGLALQIACALVVQHLLFTGW